MPAGALPPPDRIALAHPATDRDAVLAAAAALLAPLAGASTERIASALARREALASTGIGHGVALPHARLADVDAPVSALLQLSTPVDFAAPDGQAVDLVFALLVPDTQVQAHLARLAALVERLGDPAFRDALRTAATRDAMLAALARPLPRVA